MGIGVEIGVYALLAMAGTGLVPAIAWIARRRLGCMTAMMAAMTVGMVSGLWVGVVAGTTADLWQATVIGGGAGLAIGLSTGAAAGLMPALDGALSGLMGGMMGAMLGVMAPDHGGEMLPITTVLVVVSALWVLAIIAREVGWNQLRSDAADMFDGRGRTIVMLALLALVAFWLGLIRT